MIQDSGTRQEFETGAVRDIQEGKGRCDLMPLGVIASLYYRLGKIAVSETFSGLDNFIKSGYTNTNFLYRVLYSNCVEVGFSSIEEALLEVSIHFEEGAEKYGENNWQKGLPVNCYINSAIRHFLKWLRGDEDERHDRAFVWNIMCCIWTIENIDNKKGESDNE